MINVYAKIIYKTRLLDDFNISLYCEIWYYIFIANIKAFKNKNLKAKIFKKYIYKAVKALYNGFNK